MLKLAVFAENAVDDIVVGEVDSDAAVSEDNAERDLEIILVICIPYLRAVIHRKDLNDQNSQPYLSYCVGLGW